MKTGTVHPIEERSQRPATQRLNTLERLIFLIVLLIAALHTGLIVTSIVRGEPVPYLGPGTPPPCPPPDVGIWPDCHPPEQK